MAPHQDDPARLSTLRWRPGLLAPALVWLGLVVMLAVAAVTPGHFGDQAAPYRLVAYPLLALVLPGLWLLARTGRPVPVVATTLVMVPFVVDTVGNLADLYGAISWWDDLNHFSNWLLLGLGVGLALRETVRPRWALALLVTGLGSMLAVAWELGEWAFFYAPPYSARLYEDTLGDLTLGTVGALTAGLLAAARRRRGGRLDGPDRQPEAQPGSSSYPTQ